MTTMFHVFHYRTFEAIMPLPFPDNGVVSHTPDVVAGVLIIVITAIVSCKAKVYILIM